MAEGPVDEIRRLQAQIDAYTGREAAEEHDADVWLRLYGRDIEWPEVPTSVLTAALDAFRKGVQMVAQLISSGQVTTRPRLELRRACDMRVVAFRPGSLRVGLRLPDEPEIGFAASSEKSLGHQALVTYLNVAAWVSSERGLARSCATNRTCSKTPIALKRAEATGATTTRRCGRCGNLQSVDSGWSNDPPYTSRITTALSKHLTGRPQRRLRHMWVICARSISITGRSRCAMSMR